MISQKEPAPELLELQALIGDLLARTCALAVALAPVRDLDRAFALRHTLARDFVLARDLSHARDLGLAFGHDLALRRALAAALVLTRDLALGHDLVGDLALARDRVQEVVEALESAQLRVAELMAGPRAAAEPATRLASPVAVVRPAHAAVRVSRWAVRMLPSPARARYADELLDELFALADDGAGRWRQLACALRQVVPGVWQLRAALRKERHSLRGSGGAA